eukprot:COSAG04_NODE_2117_length_4759_cov_3.508369_8_plen_36_part_00
MTALPVRGDRQGRERVKSDTAVQQSGGGAVAARMA